MGYRLFRAVTAALAVTVATTAIAPFPALADRGGWRDGRRDWRGGRDVRWRGHGRERVRFITIRQPRRIIIRPSYTDYFVVRRPRFVVVRPVPYWSVPYGYGSGVSGRIGIRTRGFGLDLAFQKSRPYYGCDFCDDRFSSYGAWSSHVTSCGHAPRGVRVIAEPWDDDEYSYYQSEASGACDRYDDGRYSDRDYDRGYDRDSDRGGYGDRDEDENWDDR